MGYVIPKMMMTFNLSHVTLMNQCRQQKLHWFQPNWSNFLDIYCCWTKTV